MSVAMLVLVLASCTEYQYTSRSSAIRKANIPSQTYGAEVSVDFSRKVSATSNYQRTRSAAMREAEYLCLLQGVDVVVDPIARIEVRSIWHKKRYKVELTGYVGTYEQVKTGIDAFVEKNFSLEDIEKYKLLTEEDFADYYYAKPDGGNVTNYYIKSNITQPKGSTGLADSMVKSKAAKKASKKKGESKFFGRLFQRDK